MSRTEEGRRAYKVEVCSASAALAIAASSAHVHPIILFVREACAGTFPSESIVGLFATFWPLEERPFMVNTRRNKLYFVVSTTSEGYVNAMCPDKRRSVQPGAKAVNGHKCS